MKNKSAKLLFATLGTAAIATTAISCGHASTPPHYVPTIQNIFIKKNITPVVNQSLQTKLGLSTTDKTLTNVKITLGKVDITNSNLPSIAITGSALLNNPAIMAPNHHNITFSEKLTYNFDLYSYIIPTVNVKIDGMQINPHTQKMINSDNPFDSKKAVRGTYMYAAVFGATNHSMGGNDLYDFAFVPGTLRFYDKDMKKVTTDMKKVTTASMDITGHRATSEGTSATPFTATLTYDYTAKHTLMDSGYTCSNIQHKDSYKTMLNVDHIKTHVINNLYQQLKGDAKTITNVKFSLPTRRGHVIDDSIMNHPSTLVSGIYDIKGTTQKFSMVITYNYDKDNYTFTKFIGNVKISHFFLLGEIDGWKPINPNLHGAINSALSHFSDVAFDSTHPTSGLIFKNNDYSSNLVIMNFQGFASGKSSDKGTTDNTDTPFTLMVTYNLTVKTYKVSNIVLSPSYRDVLSKTHITQVVKDSLQQVPGATTTNFYLNDFEWGTWNITRHETLTPFITVTGTAAMNDYITKSFSETVTYNYATKAYSVSDFKVTNSFNPMEDANIISAMTDLLGKANPKAKITNVTKVYFGKPSSWENSGIVESWIQISYVKDGAKTPIKVSGKLDYNWNTTTYSFIADQ